MVDNAPGPVTPVDALDYSRHHFLIVDDSAFVRNIVQTMLLKNRAKFTLNAANGKEALTTLGKSRCDCIISDWNMAPVGGLELLQRIRSAQVPRVAADICFILLTGHADANVVNVAVNLDVSAYLIKPVSFEKLTQSINTALQRKGRIKGPKFYESVQGVEIAPPMKATPERPAAWITWMMKSPKRAQLQARLEEVHEDVLRLHKEDGPQREIRNKRQIPINDVKPGCILAEDIHGVQGRLLISAGTPLSRNVLERLQGLAKEADEDVKLWIGDA